MTCIAALVEPEKHLGIMATFVAFFPQLVAGPIERAPHMLPQFRRRVTFDAARAVAGLRLILWGAFKKIVIADRLAIYVNTVYNAPQRYSGAAADRSRRSFSPSRFTAIFRRTRTSPSARRKSSAST